MHQHVTILEVEDLRRLIQRNASSLGYVHMRECLSRGKFNPMGRRDFSITDLAPYMDRGESDRDGDEDTDAPWDSHLFEHARGEEGDKDEEAEDNAVEGSDGQPVTPEQKKLADAMVEWIRQACSMEIGRRRTATFQAQGWKPKGIQSAFSMRLAVVNQDADDMDAGEDREPEAPVRDEAPTIEVPAPLPTPKALPPVPDSNWTQLGAHYRSFMDLNQHALRVVHHANQTAIAVQQRGHAHVLKSLSNVADDLRRQLDHSFDEIRRRDEYIAELTGRFLDIKITTAEMNLPTTQKEDPESLRMKRDLATSVINQLGSLSRMAVAAKFGVAPELVELFDLISEDEKLMERLAHPEVREMFRQPGATLALGQFLDLALDGFRAQKRAAQPPPAGEGADGAEPPPGI